MVYNALSRWRKKFKKSGVGILDGGEIERFIGKKKHCLGIREVVAEYGTSAVCVVARILIQKQVFEFSLAARSRRFPELFPKSPSPPGDELPNQDNMDPSREDISGELCCTEVDEEYLDEPIDKVTNERRGTHYIIINYVLSFTHYVRSYLGKFEHSKLKVWHGDHHYPVPLPPNVQHRLMVKLQQVMEHACYAFAQQEMQRTLEDHEWNHPEAVQLDHWMNILIGHDNFDTDKSSEELEALFLSGIEIRDVAVQRISVDSEKTGVFLKNAEDILKVLKVGEYLAVVEKLRRNIDQVLERFRLITEHKQIRVEKELAEIAAESEKLKQRKERVEAVILPWMEQCQKATGIRVLEAISAAEVVVNSAG